MTTLIVVYQGLAATMLDALLMHLGTIHVFVTVDILV